ncbi:MAG: hypothetical protein ABTQ32_39395 [Myxococcaceae bacterium]
MMTRRRLHRHRRGYVLVVVLLSLLLMSVLAASYFEQGDDVVNTTLSINGQRFAATRAEEAMQLAIARVKAGQPGMSSLPPCSGPATGIRLGSCLPNEMISGAFEAPGSPASGGGWHFQYWIYKPAPVIVGGFALPLSNQVMNVYAEGYFGRADAGINGFTVSAIEAEVLVPLPPANLPTFDGDFGIIH